MQKKRKVRPWLAVLLVLLVCAALVLAQFTVRRSLRAQAAASVRAAVQRAAVQCYAVEGCYPQSLAYLEENYGLQINHNAYVITYDAFASNVMPEIGVLEK